MTTYDDLAQATDAVANLTTTSQDLMAIAQTYPSLWIGIAKHPNAYPALLNWLGQVGDDDVRAALAGRMAPAEPGDSGETVLRPLEVDDNEELPDLTVLTTFTPDTVDHHTYGGSYDETSAHTVKISRTPPTPTHKRRSVLIWSGAGALALILAVVLVVVLVINPRRGVDQATVTAFTAASTDCANANEQLATSIVKAQKATTTDPGTMDDPSLLDALSDAINTAQAVPACVAPAMAKTTSRIQEQIDQLTAATQEVNSAALALNQARANVTDSVQSKQSTEEEKEARANGVKLPIGVLVPGAPEVSVWTLFGALVIGWGGAGRTWATNDSHSYVAMWYPSMARPSVCPLSLGDIGTDIVNTTFGATASSHPVGLLMYIQRTPGQDADQPASYQAFSVTINPLNCSLGDPVEYGASWTDEEGDPTSLGSYVTSDGDIVAFGYGDLNAKWNLYAIDASTGDLAWRSGPHVRCNAADPANADCTWGTSGLISYGTDFINTQTGKVLPLGFTASGVYALGTGIYLVCDWDPRRWVSITADGTIIDEEQINPNPRAFQMSNGQAVLVGDENDPDGFRYFAPDGSYHQIFTREQVTQNTIIMGEVTQGNVYIQSNGQFLVTDLTGKTIGTWSGDMNTLPTWDVPLWPGWTMWDLDDSTEQALYNAPLPM